MNTESHLNEEQLISYIYNTLGDAHREVLDKHLSTCEACRARLSVHQDLQRRINNEIRVAINNETPPPAMSFRHISERLPKTNSRQLLRINLSIAAPIATAALGLIFAVLGILRVVNTTNLLDFKQFTNISSPFPALACFFFMFVSMDQFDRSYSIRPRFIFSVLLSLILWLGSTIIGLLNLIVIRDLTIAAFTYSGGSPDGASVAAILTVFLATIILIGVIIGGAEYHYRNIGQPSSWKLFTWTIVIQLLILVLPFFIL